MNSNQFISDPKKLFERAGLKFYTPISMLFVSLFVIVNIVTQKIIPLGGGVILTAGDFIYPLSYALSIILTEVYGYAMSRRVIWSAFLCNLLVVGFIEFSIILPADGSWHDQIAFTQVLGRAPRIFLASLTAFLIGEFIGTYILAKAKIFTSGKYLWLRTIGATLIGQAIDCTVFTAVAFGGILSLADALILGTTSYWCKIIYQLLMTPGIYSLANFLKKHEHIDIFDRKTNFNPFNLGLK